MFRFHQLTAMAILWLTILSFPADQMAQETTQALGQSELSEDIKFFLNQLPKRHVNLFKQLTKDDFERKCQAIEQKLDSMDRTAFALALQQVAASVGDAHTSVAIDFSRSTFLPVNFKALEDGIFVRAVEKKFEPMLEGELVELGGLAPKELLEGLGQIISTENLAGRRKVVDNLGNCDILLKAAGAKTVQGKYRVVVQRDGKKIDRMLSPLSISAFKRCEMVGAETFGPVRRLPNPHWNHFFAKERLLYFNLNQCRDQPALERLVRGTAGFVEQNRVENFVVDLRGNGGGDSRVADSLIKFLEQNARLNQKGKLFVIIDRRSFSSAVLIALDLQSRTEALLVGESASGKPNHYGEVRQFTLPNSQLKVNYSTKYFERRPTQVSDAIELDVSVPLTSTNWFSKDDPCLQAIFDFK